MPRLLSDAEVESFRRELSSAATRRFAERGFAGVTLRGLARDLGVSPMTPYRYFRNKAEIFQAVRTDAFRRFGRGMQALAARHADPVERLRELGRAYLRFAREEPHAYRIMFQLDPELPDGPELQRELRRGWQPLLDAIQQGIDRGELHGDPLDLAHTAWLMLHGAVTLELAGKLQLERSLDELVEPLLDFFLRGSRARPSPEGSA